MPQFGLFRIAVFVFYNLICGKIKNMKTSTSRALCCIIIAICCTLNAACSYLRPEIPGSKPRSQTHNRNRPDRNGGDEDDEIKLKPDSVIVFAAVEFRESYDWLRDSAYGIEPFIIKLYRNFDPVLEIESSSAAVSANPDTHHLLDGDLITEYYKDGQTTICRNGNILFSFKGRELLKGLANRDGKLYSLYQKADGKGFTLRCNDEVMLSKTEGLLYGELGDPSYGSGGALYIEYGRLCFCYTVSEKGVFYSVTEGYEEKLQPSSPKVQDIKIIDGTARFAYGQYDGCTLSDARVWRTRTSYIISGIATARGSLEESCVTIDSKGNVQTICAGSGSIYHNGTSAFVIDESTAECTRVYDNGAGSWNDYDGYFLISRSAAYPDGGILSLALSSKTGGPPAVDCGGRIRETGIHGYISCLSTSISLPR